MTRFVKDVNHYSGILTFVSFLGAIFFYLSFVHSGISDLKKDNIQARECHAQMVQVMSGIRDSLKEKDRDHRYFSEKLGTNTKVVNDMSKVVLRVSLTLDSIDKKLDNMKFR